MIAPLRTVRLSRIALALVVVLSGLATALVIASASGRTEAQKAALAALRHRPVVIHAVAYAQPHVQATSVPVSDAGAVPAPSRADRAPAAASPNPSPAPSGGAVTPTNTTSTTTTTTTSSTTTSSGAGATAHKVGHVFMIALSTASFEAAFGQQSVARYLNGTLRAKGTFLGGYETLDRAELPDYLALISGQAPNAATRADCATYSEFPANTKPTGDGQVPGSGCVYPNTIITLADQVTSAGHSWKAYIEDMGKAACPHPNSDAPDVAPLPGAGPQYATHHNPFIYFHSLLDIGGCAGSDVSLEHLPADLHSASSTPAFSFIAPRACDDAAVSTCPDGKPAGLAGEDAFLHTWVPQVLRSPAYKHDGVLIITFALTGAAAGGGPVPTGALVLSRYAAAGTTISTTYNPYSVLRSVEDLLGYKPLVHAKSAHSFDAAALPNA